MGFWNVNYALYVICNNPLHSKEYLTKKSDIEAFIAKSLAHDADPYGLFIARKKFVSSKNK